MAVVLPGGTFNVFTLKKAEIDEKIISQVSSPVNTFHRRNVIAAIGDGSSGVYNADSDFYMSRRCF